MEHQHGEPRESLVPPTPPAVVSPRRLPWQVTVPAIIMLGYAGIGQLLVLVLLATQIQGYIANRDIDGLTVLIAILLEVMVIQFCSHALRLLRLQPKAGSNAVSALLTWWVLLAVVAIVPAMLHGTRNFEYQIGMPDVDEQIKKCFVILNLIIAACSSIPIFLLTRPAVRQAFGDDPTLDNPSPSPPE